MPKSTHTHNKVSSTDLEMTTPFMTTDSNNSVELYIPESDADQKPNSDSKNVKKYLIAGALILATLAGISAAVAVVESRKSNTNSKFNKS
jgi:hypothetical protein